MKDAKLSVCIVVNGTAYRTAHTAAEAYAKEQCYRLRQRNNDSLTTESDRRLYNYDSHVGKAYRRIHPIFKKLFKAN